MSERLTSSNNDTAGDTGAGCRLSPWARGVSPSPTLAVDARAKALAAAGKDVCGFGAGEPDFDTPQFIKDAAAKALADGRTKYTPTPGILPLRKALADAYNALGFAIEPSQVVVSPGGKMSCYLAILATVGPGDEVLIPAPYWVSYPEMVKLAGATPKFLPTDDKGGFKITPAQLRAAVTPRTRLLILNSPSNPTGAVYSGAELRALVEAAAAAGLFILSDEIYEHLLYDDVAPTHPALLARDAAERVITVSGFAKTYAMTGWRVGTLVASKPVAAAVADLQSQTTSNVTTFAQYGALAVFERPDLARAALDAMLERFNKRRMRLYNALNNIAGVTCFRSQGAFYLFPNISSFGIPSAEFCARLLDEELVAAVPGSAFGAEGYLRLSYATSDAVLDKGVRRLEAFCNRLPRK
ncbi:MAG: pyridoxal phosphate-dependent aminotransferase [Puniceicoccales bacterium]|jgi:aspartate aminotransferase|nr:pyridoxal phosphate-dependent aminotransferase [Puniceicoccales bacterium]